MKYPISKLLAPSEELPIPDLTNHLPGMDLSSVFNDESHSSSWIEIHDPDQKNELIEYEKSLIFEERSLKKIFESKKI